MALSRTTYSVKTIAVQADGALVADVRWLLEDDSTSPASIDSHGQAFVPVTNASDAEKTAVNSVISKAIAIKTG
jgi:hypothetical protein